VILDDERFAARLPAHQHARALCLHHSRYGCARRASTAPRFQRRGHRWRV